MHLPRGLGNTRRALLLTLFVTAAAAVAVVGAWLPASRADATAGTIHSLAELTRAYGDPPGTNFARLRIPSLGVDAPVGQSKVPADSDMTLPQGPADVMWYDLSEWYALGGEPGAGGNAVFSGHLNYAANVRYAGMRYEGPGVFAQLSKLRIGDEVDVVYDGQTLRYFVQWNRQVLPTPSTWSTILSSQVPVDSITLFTCGGTFSLTTRDYSHRVAVRAVRMLGSARVYAKPAVGGFTYGRAGTNNPIAIAAAQKFEVASVYGQDAMTGDWLVYVPGAPAFVNTLVGHLGTESLVILTRKS